MPDSVRKQERRRKPPIAWALFDKNPNRWLFNMFRKLSGTNCNRRLNDSISIEALSSLLLRSPKNFNRHVIIHSRNCDRDPVALKESMKWIFAWSMRCAGDSFSDVKHRSLSMCRRRGTIPASSSHEKSCLRTSSCQSASWENYPILAILDACGVKECSR